MGYNAYGKNNGLKVSALRAILTCLISLLVCGFGLWYIISGWSQPNVIQAWFGRFSDPKIGWWKYVFVYGILNFLVMLVAVLGVVSVFAIPKLAFGLDNTVVNVVLWIGAGIVLLLSMNWLSAGESGCNKFFLGALGLVLGVIFASPLANAAKLDEPELKDTFLRFFAMLGIYILFYILILFLFFSGVWLIGAHPFWGIMLLIGALCALVGDGMTLVAIVFV